MSAPTTPTTKSSTSDSSTKKSRGRPKGWKKASVVESDPLESKGNPSFNINDASPTGLTEDDLMDPQQRQTDPDFDLDKHIAEVEAQRLAPPKPVQHKQALNALTPEDLAFEMSLQTMHKEHNELPVDDVKPTILKHEFGEREHLADHVEDYKPATSLNELESQVHMAKMAGANVIEASPKVWSYFNRGGDPKTMPYFMYKDVKVYFDGTAADRAKTDKIDVYSRNIGLK